MKKTYEESELVALVMKRRGLLPSPSVKEMENYSPLGAAIAIAIRGWYCNLLRTADTSLLPTADVSDESEARFTSDNSLTLTLPERAVRFVSMKMPEWPITQYTTCTPYSGKASMQGFLKASGTVMIPVIVQSGNRLDVYGVNAVRIDIQPAETPPGQAVGRNAAADDSVDLYEKPEIESLIAVVMPPEGTYIFDDSILNQLNLIPL